MEFRDLSEKINSNAVWWTIVQIALLGVMCWWQLTHLRGFFTAKKLI